MSDVLRALAISAGILLPIVVFIVIISMAAVRRGEAAMRAEAHGVSVELEHHTYVADAGTAAVAQKAAKPAAAAAAEEISVVNILVLGLLLFGITVALLMGISILSHL